MNSLILPISFIQLGKLPDPFFEVLYIPVPYDKFWMPIQSNEWQPYSEVTGDALN